MRRTIAIVCLFLGVGAVACADVMINVRCAANQIATAAKDAFLDDLEYELRRITGIAAYGAVIVSGPSREDGPTFVLSLDLVQLAQGQIIVFAWCAEHLGYVREDGSIVPAGIPHSGSAFLRPASYWSRSSDSRDVARDIADFVLDEIDEYRR